jgi:DinB superfamily
MKTRILCMLIACSFIQSAVCADMIKRDREHLVAHLEMTESWFLSEMSALSPAQLNFRMAPDRWTISEVLQHLIIAEPTYWKLFQAGVNQPPQKLEKQATDADVLWYGIDRTRHDKTEPYKDPKGQTIDVQQGLTAFRKLHDMMREYARTTSDDLRSHAVPEWGTDAYQCLLEISTHTQRHILQVREIKAHPDFPKK